MKGTFRSFQLTALLALAFAGLGMAQGQTSAPRPQQQPNPIHPGEVNYIEGQVALNGSSLETNSLRATVIQPGDDLSTGQGYAEVLLTPGAFLRIGNNTEIKLALSGLVNTRIILVRGSALLEAADVVKGSSLDVTIGNSTGHIDEKGLYSFNATNQQVRVLDGKLRLTAGASGETTLKKGDQVVLSSDRPMKKRDFSRQAAEEDPLYVWSKVRSHDEAEASINVADVVANEGGWYGPGWYWDPAWSFYAFAPGYGYLGGPFGWNYYSPGFIYGGYWGRGYYGRGFNGGRAVGSVRSGIGAAHAMGGMHAMGGGGFHGGGGGHR